MTKTSLLAALMALPLADREEVCLAALHKPDPTVSRAEVVAHISPRGVVRERKAVYQANTIDEVALAEKYVLGERCPFCDARGKDSLFIGVEQRANSAIRRAQFGQCKHRVNVDA